MDSLTRQDVSILEADPVYREFQERQRRERQVVMQELVYGNLPSLEARAKLTGRLEQLDTELQRADALRKEIAKKEELEKDRKGVIIQAK